MQNLIFELTRLFLPSNSLSVEALTQHLWGHTTRAINLATEDGLVRAMVIAFNKVNDNDEGQHWKRLCSVANALQSEFKFPAPAVSISGANSYGLWLSLESPVPVTQAQKFLELLRDAYFPDMELGSDAVRAPVELPPCLHQTTGKWAAFIHPGLGASFADEPGLEMMPPISGQVAFLKGVQNISETQFLSAFTSLQTLSRTSPVNDIRALARLVTPDSLLLRDATLEDIISFLHSKNIEPTFRHLIPK